MFRKDHQENFIKWFFILPALAFFFAWNIFPLLWVLGLSFHKYSIMTGRPPRFVGLENYTRIFGDPYFWDRFRTTFTYVFVAVFFEFVIGFGLALLFNQEIKGKKIMLTLMMAPMIIAPVATGVFFRFMYEPTWGIFGYFLDKLVGLRPQFLQDYRLALPSVILADIWMWSPFMLMMTLAGLQAVPDYLLEAAEVDRLSWWTKFRHIILPTIRPVLVLALLLRTIDAFRLFDKIFVMTGGGPGTATEIISMSVYRLAFLFFRTGRGSALAIILLVVAIVFTNIYLLLLRAGRKA